MLAIVGSGKFISSKDNLMETDGSTWGERLLLNLLSYSLILVPIAVVVLVTRYRLCPTPLQTSALVQWFVFGQNVTGSSRSSQSTFRNEHDQEDKEKLLDDTNLKRRAADKRKDSTKSTNYLKFLWCCVGLQFSYLIWGVLQEKIMTSKYEVFSTSGEISESFNNSKSIEAIYNLSQQKHSAHSDPPGSEHSNQTTNKHPSTVVITFHDSQFLVFINRIIAFILSIIALVYNRPKRSQYYQRGGTIIYQSNRQSGATKPPAPLYEYIYSSLSNILSSWCQYEALKYVNYPTQVLSKSCKIIAVMLMSKVMLKKRYQRLDYLCAFLLSVGMFVFLLNQQNSDTTIAPLRYPPLEGTMKNESEISENQQIFNNLPRLANLRHHLQNSSLTSGMLILALYLIFDSFTSNWQQSLFSRYEISNWQMMAATNFYSIMLTLTSLHQLGLLEPNFKLLASSSALLFDCLLMSIMSSIGQLFVYYTIKQFGPVVFTLIMTLRQFLAILLSCVIFGHRLTLGSIGGLLIVFLVVGFQIWHKQKSKLTVSANERQAKSSLAGLSKTEAIQFRPLVRG